MHVNMNTTTDILCTSLQATQKLLFAYLAVAADIEGRQPIKRSCFLTKYHFATAKKTELNKFLFATHLIFHWVTESICIKEWFDKVQSSQEDWANKVQTGKTVKSIILKKEQSSNPHQFNNIMLEVRMNSHDEGRWCGQNLNQRCWQNWNVDVGVPKEERYTIRISWYNPFKHDGVQEWLKQDMYLENYIKYVTWYFNFMKYAQKSIFLNIYFIIYQDLLEGIEKSFKGMTGLCKSIVRLTVEENLVFGEGSAKQHQNILDS